MSHVIGLPPRLRPLCLLVIGAARSGKSRYAQGVVESLCATAGLTPVFVATAQAWDDEMAARIAAHRADRPAGWRTREVPFDLAEALRDEVRPGQAVLVDCLTLWASNRMLRDDDVDARADDLAALVAGFADEAARGPLVLVSNEVGGGIVPDNALARRFRDAQGRLNQRLAAACTHVVLVSAGLPLQLKPRDPPALTGFALRPPGA